MAKNIKARRTKASASASYQNHLIESLKDPLEANAYLNAALEDEDFRVFLVALRNVAEAHGIGNLAAAAELNRENIYRMLSERGNPCLSSVFALLRAMQLRLSIGSEKSPNEPLSNEARKKGVESPAEIDFSVEIPVDYVPHKFTQPAFLHNFKVMNLTGKRYPVQVYEVQTA